MNKPVGLAALLTALALSTASCVTSGSRPGTALAQLRPIAEVDGRFLWRRTMGTTVLASPASPSPDLRIYAHCAPGENGGVGLAAINLGDSAHRVDVGRGARVWQMRATSLDSKTVTVNGRMPRLEADGSLSGLEGAPVSGSIAMPGKSIAFVTVRGAGNPACG